MSQNDAKVLFIILGQGNVCGCSPALFLPKEISNQPQSCKFLSNAVLVHRGDNAVAENFFGLLKTELFYLEKFDSLDQLEKAIVEYIDYYNNRRIKLKLNGLSPVQYRIQTVGTA